MAIMPKIARPASTQVIQLARENTAVQATPIKRQAIPQNIIKSVRSFRESQARISANTPTKATSKINASLIKDTLISSRIRDNKEKQP